jgi:hypothetical protein
LLHEDVIDVIRLLLAAATSSGPTGANCTTSSPEAKMSISGGISPSIVSATSLETAFERPSGAGMSFDMLPM